MMMVLSWVNASIARCNSSSFSGSTLLVASSKMMIGASFSMARAIEIRCFSPPDKVPNGLDTVVGSGGTYLSGGENQRVALARAILKDAPIIVLDEATAFADAENEHKIQLAFEELTKGKSVLMIAHRLSTVQDADLILVFKDGKIIERGTHDELLSEGGTYAAMWNDYQTSISWKVGKGDIDND